MYLKFNNTFTINRLCALCQRVVLNILKALGLKKRCQSRFLSVGLDPLPLMASPESAHEPMALRVRDTTQKHPQNSETIVKGDSNPNGKYVLSERAI